MVVKNILYGTINSGTLLRFFIVGMKNNIVVMEKKLASSFVEPYYVTRPVLTNEMREFPNNTNDYGKRVSSYEFPKFRGRNEGEVNNTRY